MRKLLALLALFCFLGCQSESQDPLKNVDLITPAGDKINTMIVYTPKEQEQGLSGMQSKDFDTDDGMLFFNTQDDERHFWMPDTYFDLDLFYLDKDLKVIDVIRKLPHHIGRENPDNIPRARGVWSRHVLEMKAASEIAAKLKVGDQLKWGSKLTLKETEDQISKALTNQ